MGTQSDNSLKLYIRLPIRIDDEQQVKELHPDINKIWLPRQKSRRWCVVQFPTVEILKKAKAEIKKKKINGRKIFVSVYKEGKKKSKKKQENKEPFFIDTKPLLSLLNQD